MKDGALQSGYALVINSYAPHPYAAAATVEYLLSDEGQINRAEGYARPIRSDVELPAELSAKMIPDEEYTNTIPLTDNDAVTAACTEIATRWERDHPLDGLMGAICYAATNQTHRQPLPAAGAPGADRAAV